MKEIASKYNVDSEYFRFHIWPDIKKNIKMGVYPNVTAEGFADVCLFPEIRFSEDNSGHQYVYGYFSIYDAVFQVSVFPVFSTINETTVMTYTTAILHIMDLGNDLIKSEAIE